MPPAKQDRPLLFCSLIAAVFIILIGIDRISPAVLPKDSYFYHPWEYMMGSFRYNIPRTNEKMELTGYGDLANMLGVPGYQVLRKFVWTNDRYGKRNSSVTQHETPAVVVVGDSFMVSAANSDEESFVTQLQTHTDASVYGYVPADMSVFLHDLRFQEDPPEVVLWGRVERNTLGSNGEIETILKDTSCFTEISEWNRMEKTSKDTVKALIGGFTEYAQLSILRRTMQQSLRHMLYAWTGQHTKNVLLVPGETMLFHDRGAAVLSSPGKERGFSAVADAVAHVRNCLKARGTRLIFMSIPDKEHIYASRLGREVPTPDPLLVLEQELDNRKVQYVSLVKRFQEESTPGKDLLYWLDDTHWNARGIGVAVEEVIKKLEE
ncbi:MAG: hypothetical protein Greene101449_256 [Candidatus Peregrinibacteria bacterium Greene1014_49]|nr:MAG: hypothetical protein Greene101449_256 [Candidatus Peregrinibacteria bacterium Greene1014_49]